MNYLPNDEEHSKLFSELGAKGAEVEELTAYNQNRFEHSGLKFPLEFPLPDEAFVTAWDKYCKQASIRGTIEVLRERLPQLQFPVREGISETEDYQLATLQGEACETLETATGLPFRNPEGIQSKLHSTPAGKIPVISAAQREDFVTLVQALAMKNEPRPIPGSMGALMVAGFNNWDRIRCLRRDWERLNHSKCSDANWEKEFDKIVPQKHLYQDRFIILSEGPYSGVKAERIDLEPKDWLKISLAIRLDHESAHYFTRRVFGSMKNLLMDELMADYNGMKGAIGNFRADWFLRFMGLENFPEYRDGGRLQNYRGEPPLSHPAFAVLQKMVKRAVDNLQTFDQTIGQGWPIETLQSVMLVTLSYLTLADLAMDGAQNLLESTVNEVKEHCVTLQGSKS